MTYLKKLDKILELLQKSGSEKLNTITVRDLVNNKFNLNIEIDEIDILLQELLSRKFVIESQQATDLKGGVTITVYSISVQGLIFQEKGGYAAEECRKQRNTNWIITKTFATAAYSILIVGIAYYNYIEAKKSNETKDEIQKLNHIVEIQKHNIDSLSYSTQTANPQ